MEDVARPEEERTVAEGTGSVQTESDTGAENAQGETTSWPRSASKKYTTLPAIGA